MREEELYEKEREAEERRKADVRARKGGVMQFDYNDPYKLAKEKQQKPKSIFSAEDFGQDWPKK